MTETMRERAERACRKLSAAPRLLAGVDDVSVLAAELTAVRREALEERDAALEDLKRSEAMNGGQGTGVRNLRAALASMTEERDVARGIAGQYEKEARDALRERIAELGEERDAFQEDLRREVDINCTMIEQMDPLRARLDEAEGLLRDLDEEVFTDSFTDRGGYRDRIRAFLAPSPKEESDGTL